MAILGNCGDNNNLIWIILLSQLLSSGNCGCSGRGSDDGCGCSSCQGNNDLIMLILILLLLSGSDNGLGSIFN